MNTIVAFVDFSDVTPAVVSQAEKFGRALQAEVLVVHVLERQPMVVDLGIASPTIMQEPSKEAVEKDRARLEGIRQSLASAGVAARAEQWTDGSAERVIEHLRKLGPEMVIVGSHHHGTLFRLLVGGLGNDLIKDAPCPVLAVPR